MDQDLKELKSVLRSIVVSSPTQVDVRSLLRDYRAMMGVPLPLAKYGYRDALSFLKERFSDCFLFTGPLNDPVLTLIVPDALKHIDKFVQSQRLSSTVKFKGKRRSIAEKTLADKSLIASTFKPVTKQYLPPDNNKKSSVKNGQTTNIKEDYKKPSPVTDTKTSRVSTSCAKLDINDKENNIIRTTNVNKSDNGSCSRDAVQNFLKKRLPAYDSSQYLTNEKFNDDKLSFKDDDDSGRQTSSSTSIIKAAKLEELKIQIRDLVAEHPEGVWCTDLIRLYKQRHGRELDYARFGYTSVLSLVCVMDELSVSRPRDTGDWLVAAAAPAAPAPAPAPARRLLRPARPLSPTPDVEDALPGIQFDADVFPADCVSLGEGVPAASVSEVGVGAMLEVMLGEVYSPSHFWLIRRGPNHHVLMEDIMDEMDEYYKWGEGKDRELALGAVRVGHYCAAAYEGAWHRCVIVRLLDSDTVKVRHVDYGTVDAVSVRGLRPLRAAWAGLCAQAVRARLAGVRAPAGGRRWPRAAAAAFLQRVRDTPLVAHVAAVDTEESVLEVYLIDTTTEDDVCIGSELIRAGHADARHDSALRAGDHYLYPRFEALESGATPNYAELHAYLRDGIALEYVDDYRRHVPCWPEPRSSDSSSPPAAWREPRSSDSSTPPADSPVPSPPDLIDLAVTEPQPMPTVMPTPADAAPPAPAPAPAPCPAPAPAPCPAPAPAHAPPPQTPINRVPLLRPGYPRTPGPAMMPPHPYPHPQFAAYPGGMPMFPAMFPGGMPVPVMLGPPPGLGPVPAYAAPAPPQPRGAVTLSAPECDIYRMLSGMDPKAAQWFMQDAISRRLGSPPPPPPPRSSLNPEAAEFRLVSASTQTLWRSRRRPACEDSSE